MVRRQARTCCPAGFACLALLLFSSLAAPVEAVVWSNADATPPTEMAGPMQCTGQLRYTRLKVFGGSCIWIGDRWVLTSRHGVTGWAPASLWVDLPELDAIRHAVKAVYVPPDSKVDLALLKLASKPTGNVAPPQLAQTPPQVDAQLQLGGFGFAGVAGKPRSTGNFHWGTNEVTSVSKHEARFLFDKPTVDHPREALPAMFDSGSPVFEVAGKELRLSGITVRVSHGTNPKPGDRATMTLIAPQRAWLSRVMQSVKAHKAEPQR